VSSAYPVKEVQYWSIGTRGSLEFKIEKKESLTEYI
jgi:hypothetical protein